MPLRQHRTSELFAGFLLELSKSSFEAKGNLSHEPVLPGQSSGHVWFAMQ